jgi:hypothetical protein
MAEIGKTVFLARCLAIEPSIRIDGGCVCLVHQCIASSNIDLNKQDRIGGAELKESTTRGSRRKVAPMAAGISFVLIFSNMERLRNTLRISRDRKIGRADVGFAARNEIGHDSGRARAHCPAQRAVTVLRNRPAIFVGPMTGVPSGVIGRSPDQKLAFEMSPPGKGSVTKCRVSFCI